MKTSITLLPLISILSAPSGLAQDPNWKDDWKPSSTALRNQEYPRINSERRAQFRIQATDAKDASVTMGKPLTVTKSDDGWWTITTSPLDVGFHFYRVNIDGSSVAFYPIRIPDLINKRKPFS